MTDGTWSALIQLCLSKEKLSRYFKSFEHDVQMLLLPFPLMPLLVAIWDTPGDTHSVADHLQGRYSSCVSFLKVRNEYNKMKDEH